MRPVQKPIRIDGARDGKCCYVYACNGCGAEIGGYTKSRITGHVWCYGCYKERNRKND